MTRSFDLLALLRRRWLLALPVIVLGFCIFLAAYCGTKTPAGQDQPAGDADSAHAGEILYSQQVSPTDDRWETEPHIWTGVGFVLATFLAFLLFPLLNAKISSHRLITIYRPYEHRALQNGVLDLQGVLDYHAQYRWGEYAAVTVGMVLVSVILMFDQDTILPAMGKKLQPIIVALMTISSIVLIWADLVHTNTQTPIVPINTRFKLIDLSVVLGTIGTMLMVFSVLLLIALISLAATIASCLCFVAVLVYSYRTRRVPKREFFDYFKIYSGEGWDKADHKYINTNREEQRKYEGDADDEQPERARKVKPYRPGADERLDLYRGCLARSESVPALATLLADVRVCLGISPREHRWVEQEFRRGTEHFAALAEAAADGGMGDKEVEGLLRQVGEQMRLSEDLVDGLLREQGFSKPG